MNQYLPGPSLRSPGLRFSHPTTSNLWLDICNSPDNRNMCVGQQTRAEIPHPSSRHSRPRAVPDVLQLA